MSGLEKNLEINKNMMEEKIQDEDTPSTISVTDFINRFANILEEYCTEYYNNIS